MSDVPPKSAKLAEPQFYTDLEYTIYVKKLQSTILLSGCVDA
jgi:hypothetical protein